MPSELIVALLCEESALWSSSAGVTSSGGGGGGFVCGDFSATASGDMVCCWLRRSPPILGDDSGDFLNERGELEFGGVDDGSGGLASRRSWVGESLRLSVSRLEAASGEPGRLSFSKLEAVRWRPPKGRLSRSRLVEAMSGG